MTIHEQTALSAQQRELVTTKNEVARRLLGGEEVDQPGWWEVEGDVAVTGFLYTVMYGRFKLDGGKTLEFKGDLFGTVIAGTSTHGTALFTVPLEEVTSGTVLTIVTTRGAVVGGCLVEWSRDGKHIGSYVGGGWGLGGGDAIGGGQFKVIG